MSTKPITLDAVRAFLSCPRAYAAGRAEDDVQARFRGRCRSVLLSALRSKATAVVCAAVLSSPATSPARNVSGRFYDVRYRSGQMEARADVVLEYNGGQATLGLVRAGTGCKRSYLFEAAYVLRVAQLCGRTFTRVLLFHPEKKYTREEGVDAGQLFVCQDISTAVERVAADVVRAVHRLRLIDSGGLGPGSAELRACGQTQLCGYCRSVSPELSDDDPRTLFHGKQRGAELLREGVVSLRNLPRSAKLSDKQSIQVEAVRERRPHIDRPALQRFLARLEYPLHFLDFEAFSVPLPPWPGIRVWEHIPYLYTVQTVPSAGARPIQRHYCAHPAADYRAQLVEQLTYDIGADGTVVVYGRELESRMLRRLADWVEHGAEAMLTIRHRLVDLAEPFQQFWFYHHRQRGSLSLKTVLPLLTGIDYQDLSIQNGGEANVLFADAVLGRSELSDRQQAALLAYCSRDTVGMVQMAETLVRLCHENSDGDAVSGWSPQNY